MSYPCRWRQGLPGEAYAPGQLLRQRLVEIDAHLHAGRFCGDLNGVAQIKARESKVGSEPVVLLIGVAPFECCHQVPLLGRWHQANVAVGGDALTVENHLHCRVLLVDEDGVVRAVVEKDAKTLCVEVVLFGHLHLKLSEASRSEERRGGKESRSR